MKAKRTLCFILSLAMLVCLLGACADSSAPAGESAAPAEESAAPAEESAAPAEESAAPAEEPAAPAEEPAAPAGEHKSVAEVAPEIEVKLPLTDKEVTFDYFTTLNPQITGYMSDLSENLYYKTAKELTGVNIEFILASPDTQTENFNLMIAGGDYTDIIGSEGSSYAGGVESAVKDGVYVNILDYEEYAPHYFELARRPEYDYNVLLTDGGYMAGFGIIYTEQQPVNQGYQVRQDWLDELGIAAPVTYDDWHEMLTAFKDEYSCTPLALSSFNLTGLSQGFGVTGGVSSRTTPMFLQDGKVTFAWTQPGFKDYVQLMADWYAEGLLSPDELINNAPFPDESKVITNQLGAWMVERDNMSYYPLVAEDEDFHCVAVPYPVVNEGDTLHFQEITANISSPALFITTTCEDIPLLVSWINFRYSKEGATLANYGTEGYTFEYDEAGTPAFTAEITDNPQGMTCSLAMNVYTLWRCECLYDAYRMNSTFTDDQREAPIIWTSNSDCSGTMPTVSLTTDESETSSAIYSDMYTYAAENVTRFITGDMDMAEFDSFVQQLESMDVAQLESIYQAAYDRYINR